MPSPHKLLILYTGGTIGMQQSAAGLVPAGGFEARLRAEQQAHPERPVPHWLFRELSPLLDSANMTQHHWLAMRTAIIDAVEEEGCDAVLLLHGTDTLAYSAAALSFLLLGLEIPVLLTGSMQPAGVAGSDAWPNLFGALAAIQGGLTPGVRVFFNGQLLRGARVSKGKSEAFDAFGEAERPRHGQRLETLPASLDYRQPASLHRQDISGGMAGETRGPIAAKARHAGLRPAAQDAACSSLARCKASISSASKPASSRACRLNGPCR